MLVNREIGADSLLDVILCRLTVHFSLRRACLGNYMLSFVRTVGSDAVLLMVAAEGRGVGIHVTIALQFQEARFF